MKLFTIEPDHESISDPEVVKRLQQLLDKIRERRKKQQQEDIAEAYLYTDQRVHLIYDNNTRDDVRLGELATLGA